MVSEKDGVWGPARQVANAQDPVTTMSCPAAGDCLAGIGGAVGDTGPLTGDGLLVSEYNGRWGLARLVPGLDGLTLGASAVASVTCVAPGQCTAGGSYVDASGRAQVFIAAERHGVWGPARPLPGLAALNKGGRAALTDVSCAGAGSCSAGGWYYNSPHAAYEYQAWVATEVHGRWDKAAEVPGTAALNTGGLARVNSVSCTATECTAGGYYTTLGASHPTQAFLVTERNGDWGNATQVPGLAALNTGDQAEIASVSCAPPGWCTAVGNYVNRKTREPRMFVVSQR